MTTIVYRDGVMAADSRVVRLGDGVQPVIMPERATKLYRLADGTVAGFSGHFEAALGWLDRAKVGGVEAVAGIDIGLGTSILTATPGHLDQFGKQALRMWGGVGYYDVCISPLNGFYALGSGKIAALGALYAGATAERAVEIAALLDFSTGGEILTMWIESEMAVAA